MLTPKRNLPAVITLFFVSPLVAEYLLGDLPIKLLAALIVLAPTYGGAAILIRETARRTGGGWPTMLLLGAAYAFLGEGLMTQSLFNPDYLKMHMHLLDHAYLPVFGMGAWWTVFMFNLHTFWSMGVSIALVEGLFPAEADTPWLGPMGQSAFGVIFVLGAAANFGIGFKQNQFVASRAQLLSAAAVSVLLAVTALMIPVRRRGTAVGTVPSPWIAGAAAFLLGLGVMETPPRWGWGAVCALLALDALFLVLARVYSNRTQWGAPHVLGLAAGGALAYGVHAFTQRPLVGGVLWMRVSNATFLAAAVSLIGFAAKRVARYERQPLAIRP